MTALEELAAWNEQAIRDGLVDVKFFPLSSDRTCTLEEAATDALILLRGRPGEEDITHLTF
jgi:hypothetical protein